MCVLSPLRPCNMSTLLCLCMYEFVSGCLWLVFDGSFFFSLSCSPFWAAMQIRRCVLFLFHICFICFLMLFLLSCHPDIGGFFEAGTLVKYNFMPEAIAGASKDAKILTHQLTPHEVNLTREEVVFSFSTSNAPAILMYVSSKTQDNLAVVLRQNGKILMHLLHTHMQFSAAQLVKSALNLKTVLAAHFEKFYNLQKPYSVSDLPLSR